MYFQDEMRYGLMSNLRRSWSRIGKRAILPQQQAYSNAYLYSAVAPLTGESFHLMLPDMDGDVTKLFLQELKKKHPNEHVVIVWDNAPCHRRRDMKTIDGMTIIPLPPYSPELNPAERFFEEMRRETANTVFADLKTQEDVISKAVKKWAQDTTRMKQLIGYEWIRTQCGLVN